MKRKILAVLLCVTIGLIALTAPTLANIDASPTLAVAKNDVVISNIKNAWYATVPSAGKLTVSDNKKNYDFYFDEAGTYSIGSQSNYSGQVKLVNFVPAISCYCDSKLHEARARLSAATQLLRDLKNEMGGGPFAIIAGMTFEEIEGPVNLIYWDSDISAIYNAIAYVESILARF